MKKIQAKHLVTSVFVLVFILSGCANEGSKKTELESGVVLLISETDGKAAVAAGVTKDLTDTLSAVDIVTIAVKELGGRGGGGRVDMAQGGAQSAKDVDKAISAVKQMLEG